MDKIYRAQKYSKKTKSNRHRGQKIHGRFNSTSNTLRRCRRKKSTHRRRKLKEFVEERVRMRSRGVDPLKVGCWIWEYEEGHVEGWCDCQGWDEEHQQYTCQGSIVMDINDPKPVCIHMKHSKSKHDIKPYTTVGRTRKTQKKTKKERWKNKGNDLSRITLSRDGLQSIDILKRHKKSLCQGMRTIFQPFGSHPLDEPRWWFMLPDKQVAKRFDQYIDSEKHALMMGNYCVNDLDRSFLNFSASGEISISRYTLRQKELYHVYREFYQHDEFGDTKYMWLCGNPHKMTNDMCLYLLRSFKKKHITWYDIHNQTYYKPHHRKIWRGKVKPIIHLVMPYIQCHFGLLDKPSA
jgi:hypothetical protein